MLGILQKIAPSIQLWQFVSCAIVCFEHCHAHQGRGDEPNKNQQTHIHQLREDCGGSFPTKFFHQLSDKPSVKNHCKKTSGIDFFRGDVVMKTNNTSRRASCWIPEGGGWWTRILEPWLDRPGPKRCQNRRQPCQWWLLFFCAWKRLVGESLAIEFWQFPGEEYKYYIYILYVYMYIYLYIYIYKMLGCFFSVFEALISCHGNIFVR